MNFTVNEKLLCLIGNPIKFVWIVELLEDKADPGTKQYKTLLDKVIYSKVERSSWKRGSTFYLTEDSLFSLKNKKDIFNKIFK